jgi:outer membrane biosynthesis protein TonB
MTKPSPLPALLILAALAYYAYGQAPVEARHGGADATVYAAGAVLSAPVAEVTPEPEVEKPKQAKPLAPGAVSEPTKVTPAPVLKPKAIEKPKPPAAKATTQRASSAAGGCANGMCGPRRTIRRGWGWRR